MYLYTYTTMLLHNSYIHRRPQKHSPLQLLAEYTSMLEWIHLLILLCSEKQLMERVYVAMQCHWYDHLSANAARISVE